MENYFRITKTKLSAQSEATLQKKLYPYKNTKKHQQMAMSSFARATNWAKEKLTDEGTLTVLKEGTYPLCHADNIEFRETQKIGFGPKPNIYLRHYLPAAQRAETARKDFTSTHLGPTPYLSHKNFLEKKRVLEKEFGAPMRYGLRTENERLNQHLNGTNRLLDPSEVDTHMLYDPCWKEIKKEKWTVKKDFDLTTCYFRGIKCRDPWVTVAGGINIGDNYTDGFEVVGDLSRKRLKKEEVAPKDFQTTVVPNHMARPFLPPVDSNSIRTSKAAKFFDEGDKLNKKTYPKTLKHVMLNADDFESQNSPISSPKYRAKVIQIRSGTLAPLKESTVMIAGLNRIKSDMTPHTDKSPSLAGFSTRRRTKNSILTKIEHIKQSVKTYFD